jgi:hypothetical protein
VDKAGAYFYSNVVKLLPLSSEMENLLVIPTVSSGTVKAIFTSSVAQRGVMGLYTLQGQLMFEQQIPVHKGLNEYGFDVSPFAKGMYVMKIITGTGVFTKNLIRQ